MSLVLRSKKRHKVEATDLTFLQMYVMYKQVHEHEEKHGRGYMGLSTKKGKDTL
jgi:hypothetical protein